MQVKKQQLGPDMEQCIGPKLGKEYVKGIYCHLANNLHAEYIMRNAGLNEAKLESRLPWEISVTSDMQMTPTLWQKEKN